MTSACAYCHLPLPTRRDVSRADTGPEYCCYGCRLAAQITGAAGEEGHAAWMLTRLGTAIALAMAVMVFSMPLYGTDVYAAAAGAEPDAATVHLPGVLRYASLLLTSVVFVLLGFPIIAAAVDQLRRGIFTTDLLIVTGVAAALVYSSAATVRDAGRTYFETTCMILVLVTLGRYLEATGKNRASTTLRSLEALLPDTVSVIRDGTTASVSRTDISVGDLAVAAAGQYIPVDGDVVSGEAHVDERMVTGESEPIAKAPADAVRAGSMNLDGRLVIHVTAVGQRSTVGRLIDAVERARLEKGRFDRLADRAARWFLPTVVTLAVTAGLFWFVREGGERAILTALAVLLISCPCALGIATPMAAYVALDRAAGRGVVFRGVAALEAMAETRAVALDKTGTLTDGEAVVESFTPMTRNGLSPDQLLAAAHTLAAASTHSVSRGIAHYARDHAAVGASSVPVRTIPGRGVTAIIDGREMRLGSPAFVTANQDPPIEIPTGRTVACLGYDNACAAVFTLRERIRPETRATILALESLGCAARVLTGDNPGRAEQLAKELNVETRAGLLPDDKLREIKDLRAAHGAVAMVGDGLNDTPALAAADVGIAMGCGADVAREAADICLVGNDLRTVPWSIGLARRTVRTMRWNLFWAFAYNAVGIPLAATGRLSPVFAAIAMVVSSLVVVGNSLRLRTAELEVSEA